MGCFDGVGGWSRDGIDSGLFSGQLALHSAKYLARLRSSDQTFDLRKTLEYSMNQIRERAVTGSSTACLASIDPISKVCSILNLGDSGAMILRPTWSTSDGTKPFFTLEIVFQTEPQCHSFNYPFQLGHYALGKSKEYQFDSPDVGKLSHIPIREDDILLLGTDGLFDNLHEEEMISCIAGSLNSHVEHSIPSVSSTNKVQEPRDGNSYDSYVPTSPIFPSLQNAERFVENAVVDLGQFALTASLDQTRESPFYVGYKEEKRRRIIEAAKRQGVPVSEKVLASIADDDFLGGKPDDITIVFSVITNQ